MKPLARTHLLAGFDAATLSLSFLLSTYGILGWFVWILLSYRHGGAIGTLDPEFDGMLRLSGALRYLCPASLVFAGARVIATWVDAFIPAQGERIEESEDEDAMARCLMIAAAIICGILGSLAFLML